MCSFFTASHSDKKLGLFWAGLHLRKGQTFPIKYSFFRLSICVSVYLLERQSGCYVAPIQAEFIFGHKENRCLIFLSLYMYIILFIFFEYHYTPVLFKYISGWYSKSQNLIYYTYFKIKIHLIQFSTFQFSPTANPIDIIKYKIVHTKSMFYLKQMAQDTIGARSVRVVGGRDKGGAQNCGGEWVSTRCK